MTQILIAAGLLIFAVIIVDFCTGTDEDTCELINQEYEAIHWLHSHLDDDKDGEIDTSESAEFLVSELEKNSGEISSKQTNFHQNDTRISADELWNFWIHSSTHNWTNVEMVKWLENVVELSEYSETFRRLDLTGSHLALIAANWNHYVSSTLRIRSPIHKRKLIIKAQDAILFGPPSPFSWITTLLMEILAASLVVGSTGFLYYRRHSREEIEKLKSELDHLKEAETALQKMQTKLDALQKDAQKSSTRQHSRNERDSESPIFQLGAPESKRVTSSNVEETRRETERLAEERKSTEEKLKRLELAEEEVERLRDLLLSLEHSIELSNGIKSPESLEQLLIKTYQIESQWLETRLGEAQRRMTIAKEACAKMGKRQGHLFGILRVSHNSLSEVDRSVLEAKNALDSCRLEVAERVDRWSQIEELTGFRILNQQSLNSRASMSRIGSALFRTRPSGVFDLGDMSLDEESSDSASIRMNRNMTPSSSYSSRTLRRDSWLTNSTEMNTSRESTDATPSSQPQVAANKPVSKAVVAYNPPAVLSAQISKRTTAKHINKFEKNK